MNESFLNRAEKGVALQAESIKTIEGLECISNREKAEILLVLAGVKPASFIFIPYARKIEGVDTLDEIEGAKDDINDFSQNLSELGLYVKNNDGEERDGRIATFTLEGEDDERQGELVMIGINFFIGQDDQHSSDLEKAVNLCETGDIENYHRQMGRTLGLTEEMIDDFIDGVKTERGIQSRRALYSKYLAHLESLSPDIYEKVIEENSFDMS